MSPVTWPGCQSGFLIAAYGVSRLRVSQIDAVLTFKSLCSVIEKTDTVTPIEAEALNKHFCLKENTAFIEMPNLFKDLKCSCAFVATLPTMVLIFKSLSSSFLEDGN